MDDPRQELLALFEGIHTTYNLKEADYKAFVDTLSKFNQKPRIDVEGAKYVWIKYTRVEAHITRDEEDDEELYATTRHRTCGRIFRVVPSCDLSATFCSDMACEIGIIYLRLVRNKLAEHICYNTNDVTIAFHELEVLEREEVTSE